MKVTTGFLTDGSGVIMQYQLNEREIEILQFVDQNRMIEWRTRYLEEDRLDDSGRFRESEAESLIANGFLSYIDGAWHDDYELTPLAKKFLEYRKGKKL